jgi:hypothetical protein
MTAHPALIDADRLTVRSIVPPALRIELRKETIRWDH